ncbi:MAG: hypothetical protein WD944_06540 [Steroidobacteraceae bacterium]
MLEVVDPHPKFTRFKEIMEAPDAFDWTSRTWVDKAMAALSDAIAEARLTDANLSERIEHLETSEDQEARARAIFAALDTRLLDSRLTEFGRRFMELREEFKAHWQTKVEK